MNDQPSFQTEQMPTPVATPPEKKERSLPEVLFDYVEMFAWAVFIVMVLFTFAFRICQVNGPSMEDTLQHGQRLLLRSVFYSPKQDDIIVFHMTTNAYTNGEEKTLVKRVIALEEQEIVIDTKAKTITVDGVLYADSHRYLKDNNGEYSLGIFNNSEYYNKSTGIFKATVPKGCVFVLGDNRNNSSDSRSSNVGFVDKRCILGRVVLRFSPFDFL